VHGSTGFWAFEGLEKLSFESRDRIIRSIKKPETFEYKGIRGFSLNTPVVKKYIWHAKCN